MANGVVYITSFSGTNQNIVGRTAAINAANGTQLWAAEALAACPPGAVCMTPPIVVNGMVYDADITGNVYAYAPGAGAAAKRPAAPPSIARLRAIVAKAPH
jgi:outer membrane protein assembly factor BamB